MPQVLWCHLYIGGRRRHHPAFNLETSKRSGDAAVCDRVAHRTTPRILAEPQAKTRAPKATAFSKRTRTEVINYIERFYITVRCRWSNRYPRALGAERQMALVKLLVHRTCGMQRRPPQFEQPLVALTATGKSRNRARHCLRTPPLGQKPLFDH